MNICFGCGQSLGTSDSERDLYLDSHAAHWASGKADRKARFPGVAKEARAATGEGGLPEHLAQESDAQNQKQWGDGHSAANSTPSTAEGLQTLAHWSPHESSLENEEASCRPHSSGVTQLQAGCKDNICDVYKGQLNISFFFFDRVRILTLVDKESLTHSCPSPMVTFCHKVGI